MRMPHCKRRRKFIRLRLCTHVGTLQLGGLAFVLPSCRAVLAVAEQARETTSPEARTPSA